MCDKVVLGNGSMDGKVADDLMDAFTPVVDGMRALGASNYSIGVRRVEHRFVG